MSPPVPADADRDALQEALADSLADELILLAIEHSTPATCSCGASWDLERALTVASRMAARES